MTPKIENLLRERIILDYVIERIQGDMKRSTNSITGGVIRMCGSKAWQDLQQVDQGLWRERVRVLRKEGPLVHYSIKGKANTLVVEDWQIAQGVDRYSAKIEQMIETKANPGRT